MEPVYLVEEYVEGISMAEFDVDKRKGVKQELEGILRLREV